ncbi:MAG: hypothetical protein U0Y68_09820 [Blastocatellia bacterium]
METASDAVETSDLQNLVSQLGNLLALPTTQELLYQAVPLGAPDPADSGLAPEAVNNGSIPLLDYYFPLIQQALDSVLDTLETGNMGMTAGLNHYRLEPDIRRTHSHPPQYTTSAKKTADREIRERQTAQADAQSFAVTIKSLQELSDALTRVLDGHAGSPPTTNDTAPQAQDSSPLATSSAETASSDATASEKWASYWKSFQAISNTLDVMHTMMVMNGILKASQRRRDWPR